jgi:tetratricopeptide (TPR) repeat protein
MGMKPISAVLILLLTSTGVFAQLGEARRAIERGENVLAVNILSEELTVRPTAEAYILLGTAYGNMKEFERAEDTLKEGSERYPSDSRFLTELGDLYLANKDVEAAKSALRQALRTDPRNNYASDLLATIDMSEGEVQSALRSWNRTGRPLVDDILHNYYLSFGSWVVRRAVAFHPAGVLGYSQWRTTEARLRETENFANVGLEVEPTPIPDQYNAVVRTTRKTNSSADFVFNLLKAAPLQTSYLDVWNIGNSGLNFNSNYRWEADRRRLEGRLKIPVPFPGLLHMDVGDAWRSENWNLSPNIQEEDLALAKFHYKANILRLGLKQIPHYRFDIGGRIEYRNRAASGNLPELATDSRNVGKFTVETNLRLADGDRYQNRLHVEGFAARPSILGDIRFSGGWAELANRVTLSRDHRSYLDLGIRGGTSRGSLPVEDYFVLGVDTNPQNLLRGHAASDHGTYGRGPMGTDFILVNMDIERRITTLPFFNTLNIPFVTIKWEVFLDGAKTFDRNRIFKQGKLWIDTGGGLRFETPTQSFNVIYGRSLRDGGSVFMVYAEKRLW